MPQSCGTLPPGFFASFHQSDKTFRLRRLFRADQSTVNSIGATAVWLRVNSSTFLSLKLSILPSLQKRKHIARHNPPTLVAQFFSTEFSTAEPTVDGCHVKLKVSCDLLRRHRAGWKCSHALYCTQISVKVQTSFAQIPQPLRFQNFMVDIHFEAGWKHPV